MVSAENIKAYRPDQVYILNTAENLLLHFHKLVSFRKECTHCSLGLLCSDSDAVHTFTKVQKISVLI